MGSYVEVKSKSNMIITLIRSQQEPTKGLHIQDCYEDILGFCIVGRLQQKDFCREESLGSCGNSSVKRQ